MEKYLTCEEIADKYNVAVITVRQWIKQKKLKAYKIGRSYKIKEKDLEEFEKNNATM
mgnify:CR=1 FL=1